MMKKVFLLALAVPLCCAVAAPWETVPAGHMPRKVMGRDYWTFFHEWRYSHPLNKLPGAWDNPELASLPMFRDCGLVYYSGNLEIPKDKATWRKVIGNFGGENGVWKRFESSAKTNCPATMLFHPKCRGTPALAGEIDLDYDDYAAWKARHPNLVSVRFQSEWGVDLVQIMLNRERHKKNPAVYALLQDVWNRYSWTNRYERLEQAYWYMNRRIDINYGDLSMFESFRSANFLDHMAAARGASTLVSETTNTSDWNSEYRWDVSSMFIRGAARQFGGLPWHWYVACFFNGPKADGTWVNNSSCGRSAKFGLAGGTSDSLERRVCYFAYLNGAGAVEPESWESNFFVSNSVTGKMALTPRGRNFSDFHDFTAANPGRGATYAPVAVLVPLAQGYNTCGGKAWGFCPYTPADNMVDGVFFTIAPGFDRRARMSKGYEANLHNSRFALMYDVLVPDAPQKDADFAAAISKYPAAILAGEYRSSPELAKRLADYVHGGGVLFMSASQLDIGLSPDVVGVRKTGRTFKFSGEYYVVNNVCKAHQSEGEYDCDELELCAGAKPFLKGGDGMVLAASYKFGRGRFVTAAPRWLVPRFTVDGNAIVHYTRTGRRRFPFIKCFLEGLQSSLFPVKVEGRAQFGLNRTERGWWLWCFNNDGVKKFADTPQEIDHAFNSEISVDISRLGATKCRELISGAKPSLSDGKFRWKIPAGDLAIFEIRR